MFGWVGQPIKKYNFGAPLGSGGLEEAALAGLPDAEDLDYDEQIRLATERSEREERERKRQDKEKEEEAIRYYTMYLDSRHTETRFLISQF